MRMVSLCTRYRRRRSKPDINLGKIAQDQHGLAARLTKVKAVPRLKAIHLFAPSVEKGDSACGRVEKEVAAKIPFFHGLPVFYWFASYE